MDCVTNISKIEKIYCDSYNHDVKAPIVYANEDGLLYADADFEKPVDYRLLKDLYFAGVIICEAGYLFNRPSGCYVECDDCTMLDCSNGNRYFGYDVENDRWAESVS